MTGRLITRADLANLPAPTSAREYPYPQVRDDLVATIHAYEPAWPGHSDSVLFKAVEALAYAIVVNGQRRNEYDRRADVTRAVDGDLDRIGVGKAVLRPAGEADDDYRVTIINSNLRRTSTATPTGLEEAVKAFSTATWSVSSVDHQVQTDGQTVKIAALKAVTDDEGDVVISDLTSDERTVLQTFISGDDVQPIGFTFTAVATTATAYTVAANLRVYEEIRNYADVAAEVTQAAIDFANAHDIVSHGFDKAALQAAMGCVPGVRSCVVTAPAADVADAFAAHHVGPTMASQVVLTRIAP